MKENFSMRKIIFIFPNTVEGKKSTGIFLETCKTVPEITEERNAIPCQENDRSVKNNIDVITKIEPAIIIFSNMLGLEALGYYTTALWEMYYDESHAMFGNFYILAYDNQEITNSITARMELSKEVHNYFGNIETLVDNIPSLLEILKLPVRQ